MGEESRRLINDCDDGFELLPQPSDCVDDEAATSLSPPPIYTELVCNTPQVGLAAPPPCTDSAWDLTPFEFPFVDEICPRDGVNHDDLNTLFSEVEYPFDTEISPRELERYMDFTTPSLDTGSTYIQTSTYPTEEDPLSTHTEPISIFTGSFPTQAGPSHAGVCAPTSQTSPSLIQSTPFTTHTDPCETQPLLNFQQLDALSTQVGPSRIYEGPDHTEAGPSHSENIIESKTKFECEHCKKLFTKINTLKEHIHRTHEDNCTLCEYCGERLTRRDYLLDHIRRLHSNNKPENTCFAEDQDRHRQCALEEKPSRGDTGNHACSKCGREYTQKSSLTRHLRSECCVPPQISCSKCGRKYARKSAMSRHLRSECCVPPQISCSKCGRKYAHKGSLSLHLRYECGVPPQFSCSKCGREYAQKSNLTRHLRYECGVPPQFSCSKCSFKTHLKDNLKKHMFKKHKSNQ